jgi:signal transduction histidine kinase
MEVVGMIKRESTRLSQMTKDFLDFARLESGRTQLKREPVMIQEIIEEVVSISRSQADDGGSRSSRRFAAELPADGDKQQC